MPFAWIIIVVLFWIISSASKIKKKQAAQAKQKEEKEKDRQKTAEQYGLPNLGTAAAPYDGVPSIGFHSFALEKTADTLKELAEKYEKSVQKLAEKEFDSADID